MDIKEDRQMMKYTPMWKLPGFFMVTGIIILITLFWFTPAHASEPEQQTEEYCLSCHTNPDSMTTLPSGEILPLYISSGELQASVHSPNGIECEACHTNITTYPHPTINYQTRRELSRSYYSACQKCHPDNYTRTMDSMHAQVAEAGNLNASICTDCHGSHYIHPPDEPRTLIPSTFHECHTPEYSVQQSSLP